VKCRSSIGVSSMVGRDEVYVELLKNSMIEMQAQVVVDILQTYMIKG
jgi:hypothetical protein